MDAQWTPTRQDAICAPLSALCPQTPPVGPVYRLEKQNPHMERFAAFPAAFLTFTCERMMLLTKIKPIDAETLVNTPLPPVRWLIPGLLPAGLAMLAGASKSGKSWMCLWMCLQLAAGGELWNRSIQPQTVLYLCLEDTYARVQSRLFKLTDGPVPGRLHFLTECGGIGDGLEAQIEAFLHNRPETALVVIDTLQKVRTAEQSQGVYANDYQDMGVLKALADRHGICILLVHHLRKQGASDPFHQISGSNGLMGAADTIWLLQRTRMSPTARLLVTGRDMENLTLSLQSEDCVWRVVEEEFDEDLAAKAIPAYLWSIADFLTAAGDWQGTPTQLLAAAGVADVQPNQMTRRLVEHFYTVFAPLGIRYESRRTANARLMIFRHEAGHDGNDGDDGKSAISPAVIGMAETSSSPSASSQGSPDGNEHGLCVAAGQPFAAAAAAHTGSAPIPREVSA